MQDPAAVQVDMQDDGVRLRVIAGLQRGAEMALRPGRYLVGAGEDCDIVLTDDLVSSVHLVIELADGALKVEARDNTVAVGDTLLQSGENAVTALPIAISLGQTGLGVGDLETDWSVLAPPDITALKTAADESEFKADQQHGENTIGENEADPDELVADAHIQQSKEKQSNELSENNAGDEGVDHAGADVGEDDANHKSVSDLSILARLKEQKHAVALAGALGIAVIAISAIFVHGAYYQNSQSALAQKGQTFERSFHDSIRILLNEAGLTEVDLARDNSGAYYLSGYVADKTARTTLHSLLLGAQVSFHDRVRQVDEIMRTVQFSLDHYQWPSAGFSDHLILTYVGGGVFAIDGYLGPEVDRTDLNRQIMADAPGVVRLDFKRARLADWRTELEDELERAGLKPWIITDLVDGAIHVSGEVTPKEAEAWRKVGQEFVSKSRGWPKLKIAVRAAGRHMLGASASAMPAITAMAAPMPRAVSSSEINIIGVIMPSNGPGRVLLDNGSSRAEGEALYGDTILQSVSLNKVVIRRDNKGQEFRIGERG
ncbi:MAG: FHA domain-containing protein [Pseudomonadota bacterium]